MLLQRLASLPKPERIRLIRSMSPEERLRMLHDWQIWGRPEQVFATDVRVTFVTAGRGWGKTRAGSEHAHIMAGDRQEECGGVIGIAGRTHDDTIKDLIESPSGVIATQKPWNKCRMHKDAVEWENGTVGYIMSGDTPAKFRGKNTGFLWMDEFAHWKYPQKCWEAADFDVRNGTNPTVLITSTPLPIPIVTEIIADPGTRLIRGRTLDNAANIAPTVLKGWLRKYAGTDIGKQELEGAILDGSKNAKWKYADFRRIEKNELPYLYRVIVAVDPAGGSAKKNDETGIVVAGVSEAGDVYVLGDYSGKHKAGEWAAEAIRVACYHGAEAIVAESNFGGDMVVATITQHVDYPSLRNMSIAVKAVTASQSKGDRAEPVAMRYQQGQVFHVGDPRNFDVLEHQMTHFDPKLPRKQQASPDRMDACVHAIAELTSAGLAHNFDDDDVKRFESMLESLGGNS
jgi:phage terminase large subunit-like protein